MTIPLTNVMRNTGYWVGIAGGVAALAIIPQPVVKLFACVTMFALAAISALRKARVAAPSALTIGDYPFDTRNPRPWERDGSPAGL